MTQADPLRWRTGAGWLMLAGGGKWEEGETGAIDAAAMGWADLDRPVALLPTAGGSTAEGEALIDSLVDLGGPGGYVVPIFDAAGAQQAENCRFLAQAGLVYIGDGPDTLGLVRALRGSPALRALAQTFDDGAVVVGMGAGAIALGEWAADCDDPERAEPGWGWLPHVSSSPTLSGLRLLAGCRDSWPRARIAWGWVFPSGWRWRWDPMDEWRQWVRDRSRWY